MKTIRYNQNTNETRVYTEQYLTADGKPGTIAPPWVQLQLVETDKPQLTPTQKLLPVAYSILVYPLPHNPAGINGEAHEVWSVAEKSAAELARETWHHETPLRIHAPQSLLAAYPELAIKIVLRDIKRVETETGFYLYVNEIAPEDTDTFAYLQSQNIITVEQWPDENN
jgi:hypothetical protein